MPGQALDGLALAETTPGPPVMVLQFVGFVAGWNHPQGTSRPASAVVGALVTTRATFLPCFIFLWVTVRIKVLRGNYKFKANVFRANVLWVVTGLLVGLGRMLIK